MSIGDTSILCDVLHANSYSEKEESRFDLNIGQPTGITFHGIYLYAKLLYLIQTV